MLIMRRGVLAAAMCCNQNMQYTIHYIRHKNLITVCSAINFSTNINQIRIALTFITVLRRTVSTVDAA